MSEKVLNDVLDAMGDFPPAACYVCGEQSGMIMTALKIDGAIVMYLLTCAAHRGKAQSETVRVYFGKEEPVSVSDE